MARGVKYLFFWCKEYKSIFKIVWIRFILRSTVLCILQVGIHVGYYFLVGSEDNLTEKIL